MDRKNVMIATSIAASACAVFLGLYFLKKKKTSKFRLKDLVSLNSESWVHVGQVKDLILYPIKSCSGTSVQKFAVKKLGAQIGCYRDRSFVIMDSSGLMVSSRKCPILATLRPEMKLDDHCVILHFQDKEPIVLDLEKLESEDLENKSGRIFEYTVTGVDCGDEVAEWISSAIGYSGCRLLYHKEPVTQRRIPLKDKLPLMLETDGSLYADLSGYMLMTTSSMDKISDQVSSSINYRNCRPNIYIENSNPFDEDNWSYLKIDDCIFRNIKPCSRCIATTIDYKSGKKNPDMEPLRTLRKTRLFDGEACLGINLGVDSEGTISIGDDVFALKN